MKPINVLFALKDSHYQRLLDNFRVDENGEPIQQPPDLTPAERRKLRNNYDGAWPPVTIGANTYRILSFTLPEVWENTNDITAGHKWIEFLLNKWPDVWIVIGCWYRSDAPFSLHWGTTYVRATYDIDGVEISPARIEGTPVYPLHARHMDIMFDPEGNPSPVPVDMNLPLGWEPRKWT